MKKLLLLSLVAVTLSSCSPNVSESFNSSEPTLQSAEDAMKKSFNEHSFDK